MRSQLHNDLSKAKAALGRAKTAKEKFEAQSAERVRLYELELKTKAARVAELEKESK